MPKFYVTSGDLQTVLESDSCKNAAIYVLRNFLVREGKPDPIFVIIVSEEGFNRMHGEDVLFLAGPILEDVEAPYKFPSPGDNDFIL